MGFGFVAAVDARCWQPRRLVPTTLLVMDRIDPELEGERFVLDLVQTLYLLASVRYPPQPLTFERVVEQLEAVQCGAARDPMEYLEDLALDAQTWTPGRKANPSNQLVYELTALGVREATGWLFRDLPELGEMDPFVDYCVEGYLRVARRYEQLMDVVTPRLEQMARRPRPGDRVAAIAAFERIRAQADPQQRGCLLPRVWA